MEAQQIIKLPYDNTEEIKWIGDEEDYHSTDWDTRVITNVSQPTMIVYKPRKEINTGVSIIIGPGGGCMLIVLIAKAIGLRNGW